ncbi:MAG: hypothetical protein IIW75_04145 [Bacteroidaceae bacterium]|nr:hypothetical protein [Bacteroidaceae bacterium]
MKKKVLYIIAVIFAFTVQPVMSQNVLFNAYFDSVHIDTKEMRIGEQVKLTVELSVDTGYVVDVKIPNSLTNDIEVLDKKEHTTTDNGRDVYMNECTITSFLDAHQVIPPIIATVNDDIYYTNSTSLLVNSVPIDTANLKNIKGFNPVWEVELTWEDYRDTVYLSFLLLVFAILLYWIVVRYIKNKPIMHTVKVKPRDPSHLTALQKIDEINNDQALQGEESVKDYYTRLTDTLREYMQNRYNFNAADMTTAEIIDNLLRFNDQEAIREVKELLEVADLVKFAKMQPSQHENYRNMHNAIDFVNATKNLEEENLIAVETKVLYERSMTQKRWLIAAIAVVTSIVIAVITLLVIDLGHLIG